MTYLIRKLVYLLFFSAMITNADWVFVSSGSDISGVNTLEVIGDRIIAGTTSKGIYIAKNNGTSWFQSSMNFGWVFSLAVKENTLYSGGYSVVNGVRNSIDSGQTWIPTSLDHVNIASLAIFANLIFAGTFLPSNGVFFSTDNGISWTQTSLNNRTVYSLCIKEDILFAGTDTYGVYQSTNTGTTWTQTELNNKTILSFAVKENLIFAGTAFEQGVYVSSNNGSTWTQTSLNNVQVNTILVSGNLVLAGSSPFGIYVSSDNGVSWIQKNEGLFSGLIVRDLILFNNYIYSASNNGVYRRPLDELTGISLQSSEMPPHYSLSQNYPNPFNPVTKLKFTIPRSEFIKVVVSDVTGREIETLANQNLKAGIYEVEWNATKYSSGVYFYTISTDDFRETRKMLLVK